MPIVLRKQFYERAQRLERFVLAKITPLAHGAHDGAREAVDSLKYINEEIPGHRLASPEETKIIHYRVSKYIGRLATRLAPFVGLAEGARMLERYLCS